MTPLMLLLCITIALCSFLCIEAMPPIQVIASVRGKKYDITADTVEEFTQKVEEEAGLEPGAQSVLFRGKVLAATEKLDEIGCAEGDVLNVVKGRKQRAPKPSEDDMDLGLSSGSGDDMMASAGGAGGGMGGFGGMGGMPSAEDMKRMAENPEEMQKAMQAMDQLLDNDYFEEYFADEDKLEKARQQMLGNLDQYDQMMPGFKEQARDIASSPEKWREAMGQARDQISKLRTQRDQMRASGGGMNPFAGAGAGAGASGAIGSAATDASYSGVDDVGEDE